MNVLATRATRAAQIALLATLAATCLCLYGAVGAPAASAASCGATGVVVSGGGCRYALVGTDTFQAPYYHPEVTFTLYGAGEAPLLVTNDQMDLSGTEWGGKTVATLRPAPGATFQVNVGGPPTGERAEFGGFAGGFNGGGDSGNLSTLTGAGCCASAGSGASDVRSGAFGLHDRLIVAGGAGGSSARDVHGGAGGGLIGGNGMNSAGDGGTGGSQNAAGASPGNASSAGFGFGGSGGEALPGLSGGAGGGGGYFGGGASGAKLRLERYPGGGGGGSSYITPAATNGSTTTGGQRELYVDEASRPPADQNGNGLIVATWSGGSATASMTLNSNRTSPVAPEQQIALTTQVTTSTGVAPVGSVKFVDYTNANGAANPTAPTHCPCYGITGDLLDSTQGGTYVRSIRASALRGGPDHAIVALFEDNFGEIATVRSAPVAFHVTQTGPTVTNSPTSAHISYGGTATFTASASQAGGTVPEVRWQESTDGGENFTEVDGATSTTLTIRPTDAASYDGRYYRAVFGGISGEAFTTAAALTVARVPLTIQALDATRVSGDTPPALTASYSGFVTLAGVPDSPVRLGGALVCVSDGTAVDAVPGEYDITCSGRTSDSYDITYVPGTLVVRYPLPTCRDSAVQTTPDAAVTVQLDCGPGVSGDVMTFDVVTNPAHGTLGAVSASGELTYTPTAGFAGADTFTYEGTGLGGTAAAQTVTINVAGVSTITIARPIDGAVANLGDVVTAAYSCAPGAFGGTLVSCMSLVAAGSPIDTASPGAKTFTVVAVDGTGNQVTQTVRYTVLSAVTTTSVTSSPQPSQSGQPVTYTIEVDALGPDWLMAAGTVTLHDGVAPVAGCVNIVLNAAGAATCSVVHDEAGTHTLTATFTPATGFLTSSGTTTHTVTRATIEVTATGPVPLPLPQPQPQPLPPACVAQAWSGCPGPDTIVGTRGDDVFAGGPGADVFIGGFGDDIAAGGTGADLVRGGPGDDRLAGNSGRDRIFGDAGNDRINGGRGRDVISGGSGDDVIFAWDDEFDNVHCGPGQDTVYTDRVDLVHADCEVVLRTKKPQRD